MTIRVNGVTIDDAAIESEMRFHEDAPSPREAARCALAIRELLLQRARALGLATIEECAGEQACEEIIERLIAREAATPEPTEEECRRYYDAHPERFTSSDLVEAAHILFAVTPHAPLEAIRGQAEATLKRVLKDPERFGEFAKQFSNCPSGERSGYLGQLQRGTSVPEFESALFGSAATGILPELVRTRYGFHIVNVARRVPGRRIDFETARTRIADDLSARVRAKAMEQYVRVLAGQADIEGVDLGAAGTPLVR